jgi:hypothetical protein
MSESVLRQIQLWHMTLIATVLGNIHYLYSCALLWVYVMGMASNTISKGQTLGYLVKTDSWPLAQSDGLSHPQQQP